MSADLTTATATVVDTGRRHGIFHPLRVAAVEPLTDDAVAITFAVPDDLRDGYAFDAGQHLTLRTEVGGDEVRRNYSICAPATERAAAHRGEAARRRRVLRRTPPRRCGSATRSR